MASDPLLIVFAGMPGTGKTSLARAVARKTAATYLSKETIKATAIALSEKLNLGRQEELAGQLSYELLVNLARDNLTLERPVVLDSPAAYGLFRDRVRQLARAVRAETKWIECVCTDEDLLRRRLEGREGSGRSNAWAAYQRDRPRFEQLTDRHLLVDTAETMATNLSRILDYLGYPRPQEASG
jgi:predicted kinase